MTLIVVSSDEQGRTFKDLQDEVLAHGFDDTRYRERVKTWLNEGVRRVVRRLKISAYEATQEIVTVAGTEDYDLDDHTVRVQSLRYPAESLPVTAIGIDELDRLPISSGKPAAYALVASKLRLRPIPDRAYELELRLRSSAFLMIADGDEPGIPDDYRDLPVLYALSMAFAAEDDFEASNFWTGRFDRELGKAAGNLGRAQTDRRRRVPGMFASADVGPTFVRPS